MPTFFWVDENHAINLDLVLSVIFLPADGASAPALGFRFGPDDDEDLTSFEGPEALDIFRRFCDIHGEGSIEPPVEGRDFPDFPPEPLRPQA